MTADTAAAADVDARLVGVRTPQISPLGQWLALSHRGLIHVMKNGEVIFAIISPLLLAVCFYVPLRRLMDVSGINYAQFLMPIILLQSIGFTGSTAAMRVTLDMDRGISTRFRALPMHKAVPMLARVSTNLILLVLSIIFATAICLVIGWRPQGGVMGLVLLYSFAMIVGIVVSMVADGIGMVAGTPQATSQVIGLPLMILSMCSSGFIPPERFPEWIQPFVRNQPVSQITNALRALDEYNLSWYHIGPAIWWCVGLTAVASVLIAIGTRKAALAR
ncbi:ABC transporter permease [Gordonia sp. (in: high G+C Gram-positive bacteria)]|uniref:ABC transporter permease n=1 Tax=Gordonia sp. (in: high G+C Gram-positive bacteria) TaxID=84139 RepID=UPI001DAD2945|nr:ABC transporter permease [Gordonia sp. (in: high G+C Gram-positive bacteria)]MCB1293477.1 ABC transporter permease [Gordonia sp. (in: high G+C Gram-positive bacteria)]HMS75123.1 ABC transporter permease [Gordonia sp. (in: high G+C Gram-positive bacteria)]HQV18106.1 ABC transporter permease [Gordonia sp. (in: high G+C Gram-positive bacteria)]